VIPNFYGLLDAKGVCLHVFDIFERKLTTQAGSLRTLTLSTKLDAIKKIRSALSAEGTFGEEKSKGVRGVSGTNMQVGTTLWLASPNFFGAATRSYYVGCDVGSTECVRSCVHS